MLFRSNQRQGRVVKTVKGKDFAHGCTGGTPEENAEATREILHCSQPHSGSSAKLDLAVVNAGAAIYVAGRADSLSNGVEVAREATKNGSAADVLERYVETSQALADF